jgi:hypothetical protein
VNSIFSRCRNSAAKTLIIALVFCPPFNKSFGSDMGSSDGDLLPWVPTSSVDIIRLADPDPAAPLDVDWTVNPQTGNLGFHIKLGEMPGEIAFPITFVIGGSAQCRYSYRYPTESEPDHNGRQICEQKSYPIHGNILIPSYGLVHGWAWFMTLEDGRHYYDRDFFGPGTEQPVANESICLPSVYGFSTEGLGGAFSADGEVFVFSSYGRTLSRLGEWEALVRSMNLVGTAVPMEWVFVVMDKNFARVFLGNPTSGFFPVLICDRFHHYVTFKWNFSTSVPGLDVLTRLDIRNQRQQGVTIRWAGSRNSDPNTAIDLGRIDFVGINAPSALVRGYPSRGGEPEGWGSSPSFSAPTGQDILT